MTGGDGGVKKGQNYADVICVRSLIVDYSEITKKFQDFVKAEVGTLKSSLALTIKTEVKAEIKR